MVLFGSVIGDAEWWVWSSEQPRHVAMRERAALDSNCTPPPTNATYTVHIKSEACLQGKDNMWLAVGKCG